MSLARGLPERHRLPAELVHLRRCGL
jgi:hypothetical protein